MGKEGEIIRSAYGLALIEQRKQRMEGTCKTGISSVIYLTRNYACSHKILLGNTMSTKKNPQNQQHTPKTNHKTKMQQAKIKNSLEKKKKNHRHFRYTLRMVC